jgi:hypothetical protein
MLLGNPDQFHNPHEAGTWIRMEFPGNAALEIRTNFIPLTKPGTWIRMEFPGNAAWKSGPISYP